MILFRYVIRDYFKFVFGTVVLCMFLFIMFDFIHRTTKYFVTHKNAADHILQFYLFQIPIQLVQVLPIASLLASVITMVMLSRTNEITAMRAAGMGPLRIAAPVVGGAFIISITSFLCGEFVVPVAAKRMRYVEHVLMEGKSASDVGQGASWLRKENWLFHFKDYESVTGTLVGIKAIETRAQFRPKLAMEASRAYYQFQSKMWQLEDVRIIFFNPDGTFASTEVRESQMLDIPIEPEKIKKDRRKVEELGIFELRDFINLGQSSGLDITEYRMEMHLKIAFHFAALVVCLMGLKFGYRSERTVETAKSVLLAVGVGISYWILLTSGKALGKRGVLTPMLAAWIPNIIIFAIGSFQIWRSRKGS
jgi:lipopolysaccharide export system permease protein